MALDAEDLARLQRIESGLTNDDPALVRQFRSWRPSSGERPLLPGWSVVPRWVLLVFLVAFFGWVLSPGFGLLVAVIGGGSRLLARAARRPAAPRARPRRRTRARMARHPRLTRTALPAGPLSGRPSRAVPADSAPRPAPTAPRSNAQAGASSTDGTNPPNMIPNVDRPTTASTASPPTISSAVIATDPGGGDGRAHRGDVEVRAPAVDRREHEVPGERQPDRHREPAGVDGDVAGRR